VRVKDPRVSGHAGDAAARVRGRDLATATWTWLCPIGCSRRFRRRSSFAYMTQCLRSAADGHSARDRTAVATRRRAEPLVREVYTIEIEESLGTAAERSQRLKCRNVVRESATVLVGRSRPLRQIIVTCSPKRRQPLLEQLKEGADGHNRSGAVPADAVPLSQLDTPAPIDRQSANAVCAHTAWPKTSVSPARELTPWARNGNSRSPGEERRCRDVLQRAVPVETHAQTEGRHLYPSATTSPGDRHLLRVPDQRRASR